MKRKKDFRKYLKYFMYLIVLAWIIFSSLYFLNIQFNRYRHKLIQKGYDLGVINVGKVVSENASKCTPFTITFEGENYSLINVECIGTQEKQ